MSKMQVATSIVNRKAGAIPEILKLEALGMDVLKAMLKELGAKCGGTLRERAERMLALFLLNIEGPGLKASGRTVPGGSEVDFIQDEVQLTLMMPKLKK